MAAFDTPWLSMSSSPRTSLLRPDPSDRHGTGSSPTSPSPLAEFDGGGDDYAPRPTYATFSPVTTLTGATTTSSAAKRRSVILVHQKSPLLLATPPQITRALAYSHPFLLPLNKLAGLLSWTTGDPWESFLLVIVWWGIVLYSDAIIRYAGPIMLVLTLIAGMYGRRYSPLSSSGWSSDDSSGSSGNGGSGNHNGGSGNHNHNGSSSSSVSNGFGLGYFLFGVTPKPARETTAAKIRTRAKNHSLDSTGASAMMSGNGGSLAPGAAGNHHQRTTSEVVTNTRHQKTLDEIVETLKEFTARCNLLLEPLLELTDFLSTQSTPVSATVRPALMVLFVRILLCTPFWFLLTLPPLRIITTRRVMLVFGTVILTWHARAMRVSRTILWRSSTIRRVSALVTGLEFDGPMLPTKPPSYVTAGGGSAGLSAAAGATAATAAAALQSKLSSTKSRRLSTPRESELTKAIRRAKAGHDAGVRFTFILYENQRRWVGLGWTASLFTYERPAWTDEHNNAVPSKDEFELPEVEDGSKMQWRWVEDSRWRVDGVVDEAVRAETTDQNGLHVAAWDYDGEGGRMGWVYYDNKWQNGRRGQDGWNRWTRRRKWYRDAELVEADMDDVSTTNSDDRANTPTPTSSSHPSVLPPPLSPSLSHSASSTAVASGMEPADGKGDYTNSSNGSNGSNSSIRDREREVDPDTMSLMSTSSRSTRGMAPSLRRRVTDASARGVAAPAITTTATAIAIPTGTRAHARRDSEAKMEEESAALSASAGVKLHEAGRVGSWGIGDEAQMGLE